MQTNIQPKTRTGLAALLGLLCSGALAAGTEYSAQPGGSARFDDRVLVVPVTGQTPQVSAGFTFDPAALAAASGSVTVRVADFKTGNGTRDDHMRGAFDADAQPNATFVLRRFEGLSALREGEELSGTAQGDFTVRGVTKPLSAPVKLKLQSGQVLVNTQFKFNPYDFSVRYPGGSNSVAAQVAFTLAPK